MAWASRVPGSIDALVTAFRAAPELEGVDVRDGPAIASQAALEVLGVGYTGVEDEADVDAQVGREGLADDREQFSIRCAAVVLNGGKDIAAARQRAYELLAAAGAVIARNRTLSGQVLRAGIGSHSLTQDQTKSGIQAAIVFTVDCDAYAVR